MISSPIKIAGGKGKAKVNHWITSHIHNCSLFIDACMGAGSILLNVQNAQEKIGIDADYTKISVFQSIKHAYATLLDRLISVQNYIENDIEKAKEVFESNLVTRYNNCYSIATQYIILNKMSRDGDCKKFAISNRLRRNIPETINNLYASIRAIQVIRHSLKNTDFINDDYSIIEPYLWNPNHSIYLDPPYLLRTRNSKKLYGQYEWSDEQHINMLKLIKNSNAQVLVSGYESDLYDSILLGDYGWKKDLLTVSTSMGGGSKKVKKVEALYFNR